MSGNQRKTLARRLRALADTISGSPALEPEAAAGAAEMVGRLERLLATPSRQLSLPESGPSAEPSPRQAAEGGATGGPIIRIWSDGSCSPNPGVGGWGAILEMDGARRELSGASPRSTNNMMEMTAAIEALRKTPPGSEVEVTTDSQYLKNGITRWISGWKRRGWRKADGEPVLNRELWETLDGLAAGRRVRWRWTRGHAGHAENERCDELANQARRELAG